MSNIENMIYEIRGEYVMLDSDLAKIYQCKNVTKEINQAVKRNVNRFPNDFYFQLSKEEIDLWFQNGTAKINGKSRTIENPKKKNIKHLFLLCRSELSNINFDGIKAGLAKKGFLIRDNRNKYTQRVRLNGILTNCIKLKLYEKDDDNFFNESVEDNAPF